MPSAPCAPLAILKSKTSLAESPLPISLLQQGKLLFLAADCQGGLILQKPFYADFVGPGAAVGNRLDTDCIAIYPLGLVTFRVPITSPERQQAFQQRIYYSDRLAEITSLHASSRRASLMIERLCEWVGLAEAQKIPFDLVSRLAGVSPKTVALAWQQRADQCQLMAPKVMARSRS